MVLVKEEGKEDSSRTLTAGREHFSREGANITKILIYPRREFLNLCIDILYFFPEKYLKGSDKAKYENSEGYFLV